MSRKTEQTQHRDLFAEIAGQQKLAEPQPKSVRGEALIEPQPPELPERLLPLERLDPEAVFRPLPKLDSAAKLQRELERQRRRHARFLRNLAPEPERTRLTISLEEFDWRVQTPADLADPTWPLQGKGEWSRVHIPHYGGPLGRATTFYRTTFQVTEEMLAKGALFVCFKGVDYKAHVFLNGAFLGSHEGFFAPFELDCTPVARLGENVLFVRVENDAICMGNESWGEDGGLYEGDKIYAATGPGYDDPQIGWHHCPPGMGIYQDVTVEARAPIHVRDIFVRPILEKERAEAWVEVYNCHSIRQEVSLKLSVFGQNLRQTLFRDRSYALPGPLGPTVNYFRLPFEMPQCRVWDLDTPWLYQIQVRVTDREGQLLDTATRQFGMRSFRMEENEEQKGRLYLNGREIPLRGANTMGFEQQCVIKKDWDQLRDDILLAKICHMNFWRLTQRPVQAEVYDFCDRLGLMTQTDLPLFAVLRRNQFCEAVRQAEEMERLVRSHPCNVMVSYINEPFPVAMGKAHRHLTRPELESFFQAADQAVHLANPDRVIKPVDGDYDPPAPGLPDNHCYCGWYNGHGVDLGRLHKGYWQKVKRGWLYGCGEFGSEGLDPVGVMRKYYPKSWLPQSPAEERDWSPERIVMAQTGRFHYMWFDTQHSLADWVSASQAHQARMTQMMTEAFRRDSRMTSCAIHLFIDAFPSGWMKAIMDVDRGPKPAYFAYREALTPLMANLRSDRQAFFSGEEVRLEAWVCNDLDTAPEGATLAYELELDGKVLLAERRPAQVPICGSAFQGFLRLAAPEVGKRAEAVIRLGLVGEDGRVVHDAALHLSIFPRPGPLPARRAFVVGKPEGKAARLASELGLSPIYSGAIGGNDVLLADDPQEFALREKAILGAVERGATALLLEWPAGSYEIAGDRVEIMPCGMGARHFVSRATGHRFCATYAPSDFWLWHHADEGCITPLLATTFTAGGWLPMLSSGNGDWASGWKPALAAAEKPWGEGCLRLCQVALAGRIQGNPAATLLARQLLGLV